jgi:hypothetical protein
MPSPSQVDASPVAALGTVVTDGRGNSYIYLKGVANLAALDFVVYDAAFATTRSVAASKGPGGFAIGAPLAGQYGWFQIGGAHPGVTATGAIAANAALGTNAATGTIGATAAGAKIENVFSTAAAAAGKVAVQMTGPPFAAGLG